MGTVLLHTDLEDCLKYSVNKRQTCLHVTLYILIDFTIHIVLNFYILLYLNSANCAHPDKMPRLCDIVSGSSLFVKEINTTSSV